MIYLKGYELWRCRVSGNRAGEVGGGAGAEAGGGGEIVNRVCSYRSPLLLLRQPAKMVGQLDEKEVVAEVVERADAGLVEVGEVGVEFFCGEPVGYLISRTRSPCRK